MNVNGLLILVDSQVVMSEETKCFRHHLIPKTKGIDPIKTDLGEYRPELVIEGRELASVHRYPNEGRYSPISV